LRSWMFKLTIFGEQWMTYVFMRFSMFFL
jgi:hypothetical protein